MTTYEHATKISTELENRKKSTVGIAGDPYRRVIEKSSRERNQIPMIESEGGNDLGDLIQVCFNTQYRLCDCV